ncbi:methylenetetrahydrofolate reductase [Leptolyngbya sp. AN03gr2]|uniref:methylenetetrahydrofolate reductase n=1 Tax=unclassified Leptolyngbya TaxID=2650499 RepID=UPI003D3230A9
MTPNKLQTLLTAGHFIISAELNPPRHYNIDTFIARAHQMKPHVDVIQVSDNALGQARLSSVVAAYFLQRIDIEPVVQFSLRHRNRIALQGDLLSLAALEIRNLIVLRGYPCSIGSDPDAKDATDLEPIAAIAAIHRLTETGQLFNGEAIRPAPDFYMGTIAAPQNQSSLDASIDDLETKINQGAKYIQLQAVFELESLEHWMTAVRDRKLHQRAHFLASMYPFRSLKALEHLAARLPGMTVPTALMTRISASRNTQAECMKTTIDLAQGISRIEGIRGLHLRSMWLGENIAQTSQLLRTIRSQVPVASSEQSKALTQL